MARHPITPRKPRFDLASVPKHWFGGSRIATHIANGVNILFPAGERFFVRSVHAFLDHPAVQADPELVAQIRGFFGQEGKHARTHEDYNDMLRAQGFEIDGLLALIQRINYDLIERHTPAELHLAATAAAEHFTAIMADNAFRYRFLDDAHPVMRELLSWHGAEEIEHKAVAFDVLQKVNPSYALRIAGLVWSTALLSTWWLISTANLLRQERLTLADLRAELRGIRAARAAKGAPREGIGRRVFLRGIRAYVRRDFHPDQHDNYALAEAFLREAPAVAAATA